MSKKRKTNPQSPNSRHTVLPPCSTDNCKQVWIFDSVDNDGDFRFVPSRKDMNCEDVFEKIIHYSMKTWREIKEETHDTKNKTKHHYLDYDFLSDNAKQRIKRLGLESAIEDIFSMRLDNKTRVIGLRDREFFIVKWFDPDHKFCPSK